jgi:hydrogenase nickel incorporation protein HypA/HybF
MHELSLMQGVLNTVEESARKAGAVRVLAVRLTIGDMAEVVPDAMDFAFEALTPDTLCEGASLHMTSVVPRSRCSVCGKEFEHDRYHWACPSCDSLATELLAGREMYIDAIEIEEADASDAAVRAANTASNTQATASTSAQTGEAAMRPADFDATLLADESAEDNNDDKVAQ